jgi:hypothetical protein
MNRGRILTYGLCENPLQMDDLIIPEHLDLLEYPDFLVIL